VAERESRVLEAVVAHEDLLSSLLLAVEMRIAAQRRGVAAQERVDPVLSGIALLPFTPQIAARAGRLRDLPTLDAVHLATALDAGRSVDAVVAYDRRLLDAARAAGFAVLAPGA